MSVSQSLIIRLLPLTSIRPFWQKLIALMDDIDRITGGASLGTGEEDRWSLLSADAMFETGEGADDDPDWSWLEPGELQDSAWDETRYY